jgi:hypothetical protein
MRAGNLPILSDSWRLIPHRPSQVAASINTHGIVMGSIRKQRMRISLSLTIPSTEQSPSPLPVHPWHPRGRYQDHIEGHTY